MIRSLRAWGLSLLCCCAPEGTLEIPEIVAEFEETMGVETRANISFLPLKGFVGLCQTGIGERQIWIDPDYWYDANDAQRTALLYHELGHCEYFWPHDNTVLPNGLPASYMWGATDPVFSERMFMQFYKDEFLERAKKK